MILNISFRTDLVSMYPEWLADTLLNKEYIGSRNPYNEIVQLFPTKSIEGIIFCSKNYKDFLPFIKDINNKYQCQYHYTITPYEEDIEPNVPNIVESISILKKLSQIVGKERIILRFDPILLTSKYTKEIIYNSFDYIVEKTYDYVKQYTFNFVNVYDKVKKNFPDLQSIPQEDKVEIATELGKIALKYNIYLQTCILDKEYSGIHNEGCITPKTLGLNIKPIKSPLLNNCMCTVHTYGIGNYNTCTNGCKYCYATSYVSKEQNIMKSYLPFGDISETDKVVIIDKKVVNKQLSLFE